MRKLAFVTLMVLAACSEEKAQPENKAALAIQPGQWETTIEMAKMAMADKTESPVKDGTKTTASACVTAEQVAKPEPTLFAGSAGTCKYDNFYMSAGRFNASMTCQEPGFKGNVVSNVDGNYTATSFETSVSSATYTGNSDFSRTTKVTGRRVAETCAPVEETKAG